MWHYGDRAHLLSTTCSASGTSEGGSDRFYCSGWAEGPPAPRGEKSAGALCIAPSQPSMHLVAEVDCTTRGILKPSALMPYIA
eukprot:scaffold55551_cov29-Tisochrysis_lutea.AAC.1